MMRDHYITVVIAVIQVQQMMLGMWCTACWTELLLYLPELHATGKRTTDKTVIDIIVLHSNLQPVRVQVTRQISKQALS